MKKIISTCIALMVSAACSISAFAMEVPTNTTIQDLNGVRQYIKIYTVAPDTDPQSLIDDVFEYDGYTYTYSSMTKEEQSYSHERSRATLCDLEPGAAGRRDLPRYGIFGLSAAAAGLQPSRLG